MKQLLEKDTSSGALIKERAYLDAVDTCQKPIYYFVRRMVNNHEDANDICQNTFIIACEKWDQFKGQSKISTWLHTIAYREALRIIERQSKTSNLVNHHTQTSDDFPFDGDEILMALEAALHELPEKQKAVFILRYFEEKSYEEIATITETSVGALKASYHHAAEKIKVIFQKRST
jgi:RNA polymerase sigma-70 factor (ECF subfamily)